VSNYCRKLLNIREEMVAMGGLEANRIIP